jgi:hypothetical protein
MENRFFEHPILNSPYEYPARHWEMDASGQPTQQVIETRRTAQFITPIPKPRKRKDVLVQEDFEFDDETGVSTSKQRYEPIPIINEVRQQVDEWRRLPSPTDWLVTPETARLLQHWRQHPFQGIRPFFCQVEAVETAIWLSEVAPKRPAWTKCQSGTQPSFFEAGYGRRKDDRHGDADCLAGGECSAAIWQFKLHSRLPHCHTGTHYQGSASRAPTE